MSEVQLVNGVLTLFFAISSGVITNLIIRDELNFRKYKSLLTFAKRYGLLLSVNTFRSEIYNDSLSVDEMLRVQAYSGLHEVDDDQQPVPERDSPWSHTKVSRATGNLKDITDARDHF